MKPIPQVVADKAITTMFTSNAAGRGTKQLYMDEVTSDVNFVFETDDNQLMKLPAHKAILAGVSPVFRTMFYGSLDEKADVEIVDVSIGAFKEFLQFFYLADVTLTMVNVPDLMYLGDKYEIDECLNVCSTFLMQHITPDIVFWAYDLAVLLKRKELFAFCNEITKCMTSAVFQSRFFMECDQKLLRYILKLHPLSCTNKELFDACIAWAKAACERNGLNANQPQNLRAQLGQIFHELPYFSLSPTEFFDIISPITTLFKNEELNEIIQMVASKVFQPTMFTKNISTENISQNGFIELSRSIADSFLIKNIETTTFSSNKPLLLKGFSCANVYEFRKQKWQYYEIKNFPTSKITITEKNIDQLPNEENSPATLFKGEIKLGTHGENQVKLSTPIAIRPGIKYEIRLEQKAPPSSYTFATLKSIIRLDPDIEIRFHSNSELDYDNTATGLVNGLTVERLPTVKNCDVTD